MSKNIISFFWVLLFVFCSCNQKNKKIIEITPISTKEEKLQDRFISKSLESINVILSEEKKSDENKIILIYTGYDCQSCVDKGYKILKTIRSQNETKKIFIISSNTNIGRDQERNEYYDFVHNDEKELVRKELKFIFTPIILVLDKDNCILHINFPETNSSEKEMVEQIIRVSKKNPLIIEAQG